MGSARRKSAAESDYDPARCDVCGKRLRGEIHMVGLPTDPVPQMYCTPCYEVRFPEMKDWRTRAKTLLWEG